MKARWLCAVVAAVYGARARQDGSGNRPPGPGG